MGKNLVILEVLRTFRNSNLFDCELTKLIKNFTVKSAVHFRLVFLIRPKQTLKVKTSFENERLFCF